jgi:hypothetical protein
MPAPPAAPGLAIVPGDPAASLCAKTGEQPHYVQLAPDEIEISSRIGAGAEN